MNPKFCISCVLVLFNPNQSVIRLVRTLASGGYGVVAVINAADELILGELLGIRGASVLDNKENLGLATALNIGIRYAFDVNGSEFVALFDQDSAPDASMPRALVTELQESPAAKVACIGPILVDMKDVEARCASNNEPRRPGGPRSIPTSGTVISKAAYDAIGPMMDELFIDGIDHEWCLRAWSKGYIVLVSKSTSMLHNLGDAGFNYFGQYKPIHRSPIRHYYIVRNAIHLAKLGYLPLGWRMIELLKTVRRIFAYLVLSTNRMRTFRMIGCAICDGVASRMGVCSCL
jgi:rhamnosyltransferase